MPPLKDTDRHPSDRSRINKINQLYKTTTTKAPGRDGMKSDLFKTLENSDLYTKQLTQRLGNIIEKEEIWDGWTAS